MLDKPSLLDTHCEGGASPEMTVKECALKVGQCSMVPQHDLSVAITTKIQKVSERADGIASSPQSRQQLPQDLVQCGQSKVLHVAGGSWK